MAAKMANRFFSKATCKPPPPLFSNPLLPPQSSSQTVLFLIFFLELSTNLYTIGKKKKKRNDNYSSNAADPKIIIDGAYVKTTPTRGQVPVQSPSLEAKLASLGSAFNTSQPRILPNIFGVVAALKAKNGTQQADLGLKQNVRRAEGQAVDAAAGALEMAKSFDDSILFWNKVTIEVFSNAATTGEQPGPALGSRALSIVHLAMYDAYAGALGNPASLPKYLPQLEPAPLAAKASPKAAVAGAAYESFLRLYPGQKALLDAQLLSFCDGAKGPLGLVVLQPSLVYGAYVANSLLLQRAGDPIDNIAVPYASYTPPAGVNVGHWYEPDPVTPDRPLYAPYYGATNPLFASTQRFTIDPVASIGSAEINAGYTYV